MLSLPRTARGRGELGLRKKYVPVYYWLETLPRDSANVGKLARCSIPGTER